MAPEGNPCDLGEEVVLPNGTYQLDASRPAHGRLVLSC